MRCWRVRFFPAVKFRRYTIGLGVLALLAGGAALHPMTGAAGRLMSGSERSTLLGGYGTIIADYLWLETNLAWEILLAERRADSRV